MLRGALRGVVVRELGGHREHRLGLLEARLTRTAGRTWADAWHWASREPADAAIAAIAAAPDLPEAGAAVALVEETVEETVSEESADLVDQL